jgi:DNA mismatch repair ATPase MutS
VRLGPGGSLLLVTGSNMAGKTTLLRAVGVNVLLAQAGGPVCAASLRWRRARVRTSIHVQDALGEGVSLYLAELRRLKAVVDAAALPGHAEPVLYLLDEVLHGTNSADRRTATRAVLARLSAAGAVGVVTTHDLELADEPALARATELLHFRERYEPGSGASGPRMTFDYVARPGKATSANALALLGLLGLDGAASEQREE